MDKNLVSSFYDLFIVLWPAFLRSRLLIVSVISEYT